MILPNSALSRLCPPLLHKSGTPGPGHGGAVLMWQLQDPQREITYILCFL